MAIDFCSLVCIDYVGFMSLGRCDVHMFAGFYICRLLQRCVHGVLRRYVHRLLSCPKVLLGFMSVDLCRVMSIGLLGLTSVDHSSVVSIDYFAVVCIDHYNVMPIGFSFRYSILVIYTL